MNSKRRAWKVMILAVVTLVWVCAAAAVAEGLSGDNSLSTLGITTEGVTVSPEFVYSTIEYNVTVPSGTSRLELDPVTSNSNASIVSIEGQDIGEDGKTTVVITVAAENGSQYSYYLYVTTDQSVQAVGGTAEPESEKETEKQPETEPETEDPRYVKVERNSLEEAENTISTLKKETATYRDRVELLTKILYGMIALCVVLLFVVINQMLKKKELKNELQAYRGYGYPEDMGGSVQGYGAGQEYGYDDGQAYGYDAYENAPEDFGQAPYDEKSDNVSYQADPSYQESAGVNMEPEVKETSRREKKRAKKMKDDPNTVPKPSKAKKKTKQMPEYDAPQPEHQYQPPTEKTSDNVEIDMIDL